MKNTKKKYVEKSKINDYILDEYYFRWKLRINNIYFNIDDNNFKNMEIINNVFLDNNYGSIVGTNEYRTTTKELFFND